MSPILTLILTFIVLAFILTIGHAVLSKPTQARRSTYHEYD